MSHDVFGELEFWLSSIKGGHMILSVSILTVLDAVALIALLLMGIIIDLGKLSIPDASCKFSFAARGNPKHDRVGFPYW